MRSFIIYYFRCKHEDAKRDRKIQTEKRERRCIGNVYHHLCFFVLWLFWLLRMYKKKWTQRSTSKSCLIDIWNSKQISAADFVFLFVAFFPPVLFVEILAGNIVIRQKKAATIAKNESKKWAKSEIKVNCMPQMQFQLAFLRSSWQILSLKQNWHVFSLWFPLNSLPSLLHRTNNAKYLFTL